jgi:glycosyltransferase involved in cell wall biosynthesis
MTGLDAAVQAVSPSPQLHVLTLTPFYPVAQDDGQGCFVAEQLPLLARFGVANTIRAVQPFYRGRQVESASSAPATWLRFFSLPSGWGLSTAGAFLYARILGDIRRLHAEHPVKLIHAHAALPCGHAAWLLSRELGIPFVVSVHGLDAFSTRQVQGVAGRWCAQVSRSVYRAARAVICVSERVRTQVAEGAPELNNTTVLYNGVDPQLFRPLDTEPAEALILTVGNLIPTKGHELLLRGFAGIKDRFPRLSLVVIGDGTERPRLEKLARELDIGERVRFQGRQSRAQVAEAMRIATVFALLSRYEGLGCVYLEAMSSGKPVIACRGQGIEEVIENGVNGFLIGPEDLPGLIEVLSELLQKVDVQRRIGEAARRTILQGFTQEQQAARLFHLYQECLE